MKLPSSRRPLLLTVALGLAIAACGGDDSDGDDADTAATTAQSAAPSGTGTAAAAPAGDMSVVVGSKDFTEQFILAEMYSQALSAAGFDVETEANLGSTQITDGALQNGDIDVYPEYTGTMLLYVCEQGYDPGMADQVYDLDQTCYNERGLTLLDPTNFSNGNAVACTQEFADANGLTTMSDLGAVADDVRYATVAEQLTAETGLPLIKEQYGFEFGDVKTYDVSLRYKAIENGEADCVYAFGTDSALADLGLVVLEDDKSIWPADQPTPIVRTEWLAEVDPRFTEILNAISAQLDDQTMQALNARVDIDQEDPADVAAAWLTEQGLI